MDKMTRERIELMVPMLDEKVLRQYLAVEAKSLGRGGISEVSKLTGVSRTTITVGSKENASGIGKSTGERIRKEGGGRKRISDTNKRVMVELERFLDNDTYGNPENPLKWTTKSLRHLAEELNKRGISVGHVTVGKLLEMMEYSLQKNKKCLQVGEGSIDRDAQFRFINEKAKLFMSENQPVISVDAKKKEKIGNFFNDGQEYTPKGSPLEVLDHDFELKDKGKVCPYGVYDIDKNVGYVNLGVSCDTAEFAVQSLQNWWTQMGRELYSDATKLLVICDSGGSNGYRLKLWKISLQQLANTTGLDIHVSHLPPGTSKWNKIEHRMFCHISKNWRGRPLESTEIVVNLISATTTSKGLKIVCELDINEYQRGIKVSDDELSSVNIIKFNFHGEWNYAILKSLEINV